MYYNKLNVNLNINILYMILIIKNIIEIFNSEIYLSIGFYYIKYLN